MAYTDVLTVTKYRGSLTDPVRETYVRRHGTVDPQMLTFSASDVLGVPLAESGAASDVTVGSLTHGDSYTITGSGFGTNPGTQLLFDQMTGGDWNEEWTIAGREGGSGGAIFSFDQTASRHSRNGGWNAVASINGDDDFAGVQGGTPARTWFVQFWWRPGTGFQLAVENSGGFLSNVKALRMWAAADPGDEYALFTLGSGGVWTPGDSYGNWEREYKYGEWHEPGNPPGPYDDCRAVLNAATGSWQCFQFEFQSNSALSARDGILRMWHNGALKFAHTWLPDRTTYAGYKRPQIVGVYNSGVSGGPAEVRYHDPYIADTWCRVELGNHAADYNSCTHREVQRVTNWSAAGNSITVTANCGSFTNGDTAYLWVTDSAGTHQMVQSVTVGG